MDSVDEYSVLQSKLQDRKLMAGYRGNNMLLDQSVERITNSM